MDFTSNEMLALFATSVFIATLVGLLLRGILLPHFEKKSALDRSKRPDQSPVNRRKMAVNPNVVCSLPMHDVPRRQVPLY